jgi:hypothetical protein
MQQHLGQGAQVAAHRWLGYFEKLTMLSTMVYLRRNFATSEDVSEPVEVP